jgi:conjugative transposon TraM protein
MKINFKQPKYILPLILLPFLCLFFFVYHSSFAKKKKNSKQETGINGTVGDVSPEVRKKQLEDKLDAYRNSYKDADGYSAVNALPEEKSSKPAYDNTYSDKQKRMLDSINRVMKERYNQHNPQGNTNTDFGRDKEMAEALNNLSQRQSQQAMKRKVSPAGGDLKGAGADPMELFKQQMAYIDSINKANDPAVKAERQKKEALAKAAAEHPSEPALTVSKATGTAANFNTVMPQKPDDFIKVVVDENVTGYAGSRIRLRLLDDINAGRFLIPRDTYLYALISGFSGQRVNLFVKSILFNGKILPVKLEIYDLDGLPGLYVPESAFRDFTKDLGNSTIQGVTIDNGGTGSVAQQFVMSTVGKIFESTSSAIAGIIRKDKAKIKYNSYLYLIDEKNLNQ